MPAICAAAPLLWIASDAAITGEPLWSLTHTQDLAAEIGRRTGLGDAPGAFVDQLRALTSRVVLVLGAVGAVLAFPVRRTGAVALIGVIVAGAFTYMLIGAADLSLIDRYLLPSAIALTLLASYSALGWVADRDRLPRLAWAGTATLSALGIAATLPNRLHDLQTIPDENRDPVAMVDELRDMSAHATCTPVHVPYDRGIMRPTVAQARELTPGAVPTFDREPGHGTFIAPRDADAAKAVRGTDAAPILDQPGPGVRIQTTRYWVVTRAGCR